MVVRVLVGLVLAAVVAVVVQSLPDIARYLKIRADVDLRERRIVTESWQRRHGSIRPVSGARSMRHSRGRA